MNNRKINITRQQSNNENTIDNNLVLKTVIAKIEQEISPLHNVINELNTRLNTAETALRNIRAISSYTSSDVISSNKLKMETFISLMMEATKSYAPSGDRNNTNLENLIYAISEPGGINTIYGSTEGVVDDIIDDVISEASIEAEEANNTEIYSRRANRRNR